MDQLWNKQDNAMSTDIIHTHGAHDGGEACPGHVDVSVFHKCSLMASSRACRVLETNIGALHGIVLLSPPGIHSPSQSLWVFRIGNAYQSRRSPAQSRPLWSVRVHTLQEDFIELDREVWTVCQQCDSMHAHLGVNCGDLGASTGFTLMLSRANHC